MLVASRILMMPLWLILQKEFSRHNFFVGIGRHGINPWQVRYQGVAELADLTVFAIHRHAGKIAYVLVGTGSWLNKVVFPQF